MEMQLKKEPLSYLEPVVCSGRELEQTQQIRLPEGMPDIRGLKVLRPGLELGVVKKDRFEPAHALALWLSDCAVSQSLAVDSGELKAYLHGDVIPTECKGWCLVKAGNYAIGWGKGDKTVLKNHYPKGLRR